MSKVVVKGKFQSVYHNTPVTVEWEMPIEYANAEVFEKIKEEMRRITRTLKRQEQRELLRRRNQRLQNFALHNLRWLFIQRPKLVDGKPVIEQLRLGRGDGQNE